MAMPPLSPQLQSSRESSETPVVIVGAGPTGLTMANLLARSGVACRIIDAKAGPAEESRALVVHAKILELLDKIGLAAPAVAAGQPISGVDLYSGGRQAGMFSLRDGSTEDRTPFPFVLIFEQDRTERLLAESLAAAPVQIEWNTALMGLEPRPDGVRVRVRRPDGREETIEAGWVVGADGARSPVRHALGLGFAGETYEQTLFLADVDLAGTLGREHVLFDLSAQGFLAIFPMPGERRFRLVGNLPRLLEGADEISQSDLQAIIDHRPEPIRSRITQLRWASVYRTHHRMAERFRQGRVFLAGDAAHIHSPAGGQRMNTGIGDAYNLGWKLALVVNGQAPVSLLDSYQAERVPFARAILNGSDRVFRFQDTPNPLAQTLKLVAVPPIFRVLSHSALLQSKLFWLASQLWTRYRKSPVVAESGPVGRLPRAGDRAPYGVFETGPEAGTSLFQQLRGVDHHLLLFGGLQPDPELLQRVRAEIATTLDRYPAPISLHEVASANRTLQERYGADRPSVFLIRPDGQIAYRGDAADVAALTAYLDRVFVRGAAAATQSATAAPSLAAR